jgi:hypothetical protein
MGTEAAGAGAEATGTGVEAKGTGAVEIGVARETGEGTVAGGEAAFAFMAPGGTSLSGLVSRFMVVSTPDIIRTVDTTAGTIPMVDTTEAITSTTATRAEVMTTVGTFIGAARSAIAMLVWSHECNSDSPGLAFIAGRSTAFSEIERDMPFEFTNAAMDCRQTDGLIPVFWLPWEFPESPWPFAVSPLAFRYLKQARENSTARRRRFR